MTGFVVGGLLGAAAAMYFNRGNNKWNMAALSNAGSKLDQFIDTARSRMMDPDRRSYYGQTNSGTSVQNATSGNDLGKVQEIVNQDPQLSRQVGDILAESGTATTSSTIR